MMCALDVMNTKELILTSYPEMVHLRNVTVVEVEVQATFQINFGEQ